MLANLVYYFYRILYGLWRVKIVEHDSVKKILAEKKPLILAHWHGDELALLHLVGRYQLATMTSTSRDGEIIDQVIQRYGGATTRGSSTRGGISALKGLIRLMREGRVTSFAVDGPRGPIYKPKPGVFELSRLCEAYIAPVGVVASRAWISKKSWNKAFLPLPFSKVAICIGEPMEPVAKEAEPKDLRLAQILTNRLNTAKQQASKIIATM